MAMNGEHQHKQEKTIGPVSTEQKKHEHLQIIVGKNRLCGQATNNETNHCINHKYLSWANVLVLEGRKTFS